jgi:hypothetical protein
LIEESPLPVSSAAAAAVPAGLDAGRGDRPGPWRPDRSRAFKTNRTCALAPSIASARTTAFGIGPGRATGESATIIDAVDRAAANSDSGQTTFDGSIARRRKTET